MDQNLIFVDLSFEGWEYSDDDLDALGEEFSAVGVVHTTGGWAPAAVPAATVEIVLTFVGQTFAALVITKGLERAWTALSGAWRGYRERRRAGGGQKPRLARLVLRASDFDIEIRGVVDLNMEDVLERLRLLGQRRTSGALEGQPIRRVCLPSIREGGEWRVLHPWEGAKRANLRVWFVQSKSADPWLGFYDAKKDRWL